MNKTIIILGLLLFIPLLSISQALRDSSTGGASNSYNKVSVNVATDYLKNANKLELIDWSKEADRKVIMFYKYLSYLIDVNVDEKTKSEAAMMALELFADSTMVCDSLLLVNKQQTIFYDVEEFLKQMLEFDKSNVDIAHLFLSNKVFFDPNTTTKTYDITESITFTALSDKIIYVTSKTVIVHFISLENSSNDKVEFVVKLGDINFRK